MKQSLAGSIETSIIVLVLVVGAPPSVRAESTDGDVAPGLRVGDVLDQSNADRAADLLPPEIIKHYKTGGYHNRIIAYPTGNAHWEKSFLEATEENATRLDVDARGTIIDRTTGKQAEYYYGIPFPRIDPKDPNAGVKIA